MKKDKEDYKEDPQFMMIDNLIIIKVLIMEMIIIKFILIKFKNN
jgi:hypothetical protein